MDSALAHSFPGYSQPEHHLNHILQFHPHLQLVDDSSRFPSNSSSSVSLTSMFPMPGGSSCSSNFQYSHPPPPPLLPLSRRGSDCSVLSNASSDGDGGVLMMVESRSRLTREQIQLLERQFSDSPKPNTKIRRALADTTGLSVQRVGNWFQNRRAKAKQQKRQEEMQTRQILALAGRRRATEPSSPVSSAPLLLSTGTTTASSGAKFPADSTMITPNPPRRAKSFADIPSTPARFAEKHGEGVSPYSSPSEASYASLARSLAIAAAAAAHADSVGGFQENSHEIPNQSQPQSQFPGYMHHPFTLSGTESPWPISRFSDYGSSTASSIIYTPTPAGQLEDPFEYDQISPDSDHHYDGGGNSQSNNGPAEPASYFDYHYPQEDFSAFAAAIDATSTQRAFVLPAMPPTRFLRSPRVGDGQEFQPQPHRNHNLQQREEVSERHFIRRDSCPGEFLDAFSSIELPEQAEEELPRIENEPTPEAEPSHQSLANRRKAPSLTPIGTASLRDSLLTQSTAPPHSSTLPSSNLSLPATPMRRIKSTSSTTTDATTLSKFSPPSSPPITAVQAKYFDGLLDGLDWGMEEVDPTATIRPRTAGCGTTTGKVFSLANIFKVEAPPTPVSPADVSATTSSSSSPPTTTTNNKTEAGMSPPATPAHQQCASASSTATTPREANFETAQYRICTASQSQLSGVPRTSGEEFCNGDAGGMVGFMGFGGGGGEEFGAFGAAEAGGKEEEFPFERYLAAARGGSGEGVF